MEIKDFCAWLLLWGDSLNVVMGDGDGEEDGIWIDLAVAWIVGRVKKEVSPVVVGLGFFWGRDFWKAGFEWRWNPRRMLWLIARGQRTLFLEAARRKKVV